MREIKFRAWNEPTKEFIYFGLDVRSLSLTVTGTTPGDKYTCLQEYTGLKDKNGVEIYEGDYVIDEGAAPDDFWEVEWLKNCFQLKHSFVSGEYCMFEQKHADTMMVLGNRYENPELISVAQ